MKRLGNYSIRILGHVAMRLKERRRQKKEQEGAKRNETAGVWKKQVRSLGMVTC